MLFGAADLVDSHHRAGQEDARRAAVEPAAAEIKGLGAAQINGQAAGGAKLDMGACAQRLDQQFAIAGDAQVGAGGVDEVHRIGDEADVAGRRTEAGVLADVDVGALGVQTEAVVAAGGAGLAAGGAGEDDVAGAGKDAGVGVFQADAVVFGDEGLVAAATGAGDGDIADVGLQQGRRGNDDAVVARAAGGVSHGGSISGDRQFTGGGLQRAAGGAALADNDAILVARGLALNQTRDREVAGIGGDVGREAGDLDAGAAHRRARCRLAGEGDAAAAGGDHDVLEVDAVRHAAAVGTVADGIVANAGVAQVNAAPIGEDAGAIHDDGAAGRPGSCERVQGDGQGIDPGISIGHAVDAVVLDLDGAVGIEGQRSARRVVRHTDIEAVLHQVGVAGGHAGDAAALEADRGVRRI